MSDARTISQIARLAEILAADISLNAYIKAGGMLAEPVYDDDCWELGRNLGDSYCIDGQGKTLIECLLSVPEEVWEEIATTLKPKP